MSKKYSNSELEKLLNERYHKEFRVETNQFNVEINKFQFLAVPVDNAAVRVHGSYKDNNSDVLDNYMQMEHSYQAEEVMKEQLDKYYEQYAVKANAAIDKYTSPSFLELVSNAERDIIIYYYIYLFDNAYSLEGIKSAVDYFKNQYYGTYTFTIYFWSPEFLKGKDFEKMKFGFNYNSDKYADNLMEKREYIKQELIFEFDASENTEITIERLHELLAPYKKGKQYNRL
ncbi:hypothetical protein JMN32_20990 [Fulvivirga sp. 29W222]|uniref:Uncharacterized protein n=1 Tax=Fulvivirga marina TaxID=2494733 RepID=A0A937KD54_9BACT|nr:hypothetical protein [Fulvivirga marina]MBL6448801.1 hypothetical protein [Fulvivirga marina]